MTIPRRPAAALIHLTLSTLSPFTALAAEMRESHHPLGIDWDPAPSPEDGPTLSRGASRNLSILPAQIGGIVSAYVFFVFTIGLIMLFVGRRLRASAQTSRKTLDVEMVKPAARSTDMDPSPISPEKRANGNVWPSPVSKLPPPHYVSPDGPLQQHPVTQSTPHNFSWPSPQKEQFNSTFDGRVVQRDREKAQSDMDRLYAAVMEQDEQNASSSMHDDNASDHQSPTSSRKQARWPSMQTSTSSTAEPAATLHSPTKLFRMSRPSKMSPPQGPTSALASPAAQLSKHNSRTSSIASDVSGRSKRKTGVRGLGISSPTIISSTSLGIHGPPQNHSRHPSTSSSQAALPSPRSSHSLPPPASTTSISPPTIPTTPPPHTLVPTIYPPRSHPISLDAALYPPTTQLDAIRNTANVSTSTTTTLTPSTARSTPTPKPLPFRSLPPSNSSSTTHLAPTSPTATRTTILNARPHFSPRFLSPTLMTGRSILSPGQVPYSPYMPFTPITPITPRLVTRQERRQRERDEGRVVVAEKVKPDPELWGDAYE